jgi:adenine-specific DNA-methyltransferase
LLSEEEEMAESVKLTRLNYIGSKHQLYDFIKESLLDFTEWESLEGHRIGDLFSGTGIISYYLRNDGAVVTSNDTELYSVIICRAMNSAVYNEVIEEKIHFLNENAEESLKRTGFITKNYSPYVDPESGEACERMFYTVENAQIIDGFRDQIEAWKAEISENDYNFLLASLIVSADQFSNIPAVYGCYLKNFKAKALKRMTISPIHQIRVLGKSTGKKGSEAKTLSISADSPLMAMETFDAVYLDPPYNERQYSKNYFVLNMIGMYEGHPEIKGKTGIPITSYISPFCQKKTVKGAFENMVKQINSTYIFISYSNEGLIGKEEFTELLGKYGEVKVYEKEYKRFKSFKYNESGSTTEFIFALRKSS